MMPGTQLHTREPAAKQRGAAPVNDRRPADGQRATLKYAYRRLVSRCRC